ncbi:hypothetical protein BDZ45DRAFT_699513 [Neofusicoccum parvum]|nr:hypothetical protein BDZ45DRAFT_699513 [Neofusicoccum parvum]
MARRNVLSDSVWFDTDYIICTGIVLFLRGLRTPADDVLAKARDLMPLLEMTRKSFLGNYTFETLSGLLNDLELRDFHIAPQDFPSPGMADVSALFHADMNLTEMMFELG